MFSIESPPRDSDVDTGVFDKRGRKRHDGGKERRKTSKGWDNHTSSL